MEPPDSAHAIVVLPLAFSKPPFSWLKNRIVQIVLMILFITTPVVSGISGVAALHQSMSNSTTITQVLQLEQAIKNAPSAKNAHWYVEILTHICENTPGCIVPPPPPVH